MLEKCPGCRLVLPEQPGPAHPYIGASPSCWALYGEVLAREYSSAELMKVHRLTVDAYAAQHPGTAGRRSIQSVWAHLAGLYLTVERKLAPDFARRAIGALTRDAASLHWLEPPALLGTITVARLAEADASSHEDIVRMWAQDVWQAWSAHHAAIASVADDIAARL